MTRRPIQLVVLAAAAAAAIATAVLPGTRARAGRPGPPSFAVYPRQSLPISFSHVDHLTTAGLDCAACHERAWTSTSSADDLLPGEAACLPCHAIDRSEPARQVPPGQPAARCDACHPNWDGEGEPARVRIPPPNLRFNHRLHVERGIDCARCHGDFVADQVHLATREHLPREAVCLECHDGHQAPSRCSTCHPQEAGGRLRTDFPEGRLVPSGKHRGDAHDLRFRTDHGRIAAMDPASCLSCHQKQECVDCHDGKMKPLDFHGNDYLRLHVVDARRNDPDCSGCHRLQTFCTGCHARAGVSDDPRTTAFDREQGRRFHPPGFADPHAPGMRQSAHHAFEARRNLRACVSCHREEFCVGCHAPATRAINPHPIGWGQSPRCRALAEKNARMCLRCHVDAATLRCD
jgi:hypothetical protein